MTYTERPTMARAAILDLMEPLVAEDIAAAAAASEGPDPEVRINQLTAGQRQASREAFSAVWPECPVNKRNQWVEAFLFLAVHLHAAAYDVSVHPAGPERDRALEYVAEALAATTDEPIQNALAALAALPVEPEDISDPARRTGGP